MEFEKSKLVEQPHSVEISINAKGAWSGCVKVYGTSPDEAMANALKKAKELEVLIAEKNAGMKKE